MRRPPNDVLEAPTGLPRPARLAPSPPRSPGGRPYPSSGVDRATRSRPPAGRGHLPGNGRGPLPGNGRGRGGSPGNGRGPAPGLPGGEGRPASAPAKGPASNRRAARKPTFWWRYRRVWFLFGMVAVTALAGAAWVLTQVPLPPEAPQPQTTIIYDANGAELATLHGHENRFPVQIEQVPRVVQDAVVAAEDRKFFEHGGIDPLSILRATWADIRQKGATQGGSTITQQYVKQVYVGSDPTLWRKLREAVIAVKLERKLSKDEILERYLNTVYFGRGAYGIQAASRTWFGVDVEQLGLKEAAYLVGLIRSPSAGDVASDPELANDLRAIVLDAMVETEAITPAQAQAVKDVPLQSYVFPRQQLDSTVSRLGIGAEYFVQYVRDQLVARYSEDFVFRQGLRVRTSLDPHLQAKAYEAVYGLLDQPGDPAGALVALDQQGRVVAMVGGRSWQESKVNLAVGVEGGGGGRQGGSTFKPFALAAAVYDGYSLESSFPGPARIVLPRANQGSDWEVANYEGAAFGRVNLIDATVHSVNTVYAQLVETLGPQKVAEMAQRLGITSELAPVPSIALGTQNVSVLEMAAAYSTLAQGGMRYDPRVITEVSINGSVQEEDRPRGVRVLEKAHADQLNFVLEQVVARGSGTGAQVDGTKVWGKTGTTEDFGDAWFVGYTRSLTVAVWMGYPEGQSRPLYDVHGVRRVNGGSLPARIFQRFVGSLPPENDDLPSPVPELGGRPLSVLVRYTTPTSAPPAGPPPAPEPVSAAEPVATTAVVPASPGAAVETGTPVESSNDGASSTVNTIDLSRPPRTLPDLTIPDVTFPDPGEG